MDMYLFKFSLAGIHLFGLCLVRVEGRVQGKGTHLLPSGRRSSGHFEAGPSMPGVREWGCGVGEARPAVCPAEAAAPGHSSVVWLQCAQGELPTPRRTQGVTTKGGKVGLLTFLQEKASHHGPSKASLQFEHAPLPAAAL